MSAHPRLILQSRVFLHGFPTKTLYAFLFPLASSTTRPTCLIVLDLVTRIIFAASCRLWGLSWCICFRNSLGTLFPKTLRLYSFLNVTRRHVQQTMPKQHYPIVFFTNLMHKFFISMHLLHSSTCFEHYCAHLQEDSCLSTASGIVTLFRWLFSTQVTRGVS